MLEFKEAYVHMRLMFMSTITPNVKEHLLGKTINFHVHMYQWWDMKTTKTGDDEVTHVFKYWSLLTHRYILSYSFYI